MIIYVLLILLIILSGIFFQKRNKKIYSAIVCILLTLVAGLRNYSIGNDTSIYLQFFNNVFNVYQTSRFEIGFIYFTLITKKIFNNFTIFLLIISFFINFSICKLIRNDSPNMLVSFLLFFFGRFFFNEMNIIRQLISVAIVIFSFKYIYNRKFLNFLFYIILATLFHKSAFINIILYFLYDIKITKKIGTILSFSSIILFLFFQKIISYITIKLNMYEGYVDSFFGSNKTGNIIFFIMYFVILIYILLIRSKKSVDKNNQKENFYIWLLILTTIISFLSIRISVLSRIQNYFDLFAIICIPLFTEKIKSRNKLIIYYIILSLFTISCILILYYRPEWYYVYPYQFFKNI